MNRVLRYWLNSRQFFAIFTLALAVFNVQAEATPWVGEAIFVTGEVWADAGKGQKALQSGNRLADGTSLQTGPKGHAYIRMTDGGFFILRPNSKAKIVNYIADLSMPSNSKLRLDLESGHVRAISGEAAHRAPDSFRLNTPIAAIGVRGTDFTVSTTTDNTRVTVSEGIVVVDKLGAGCAADTFGPCSSSFAQVLRATDMQSLEVLRNEPALRREALEDTKNAAASASKTNTASYTNTSAESVSERLNQASTTRITNTADTVETRGGGSAGIVVDDRQRIFWGRWRAVDHLTASASVSDGLKNNEGFSDGPLFSLWREAGSMPTLPQSGQWNFQLSGQESYFLVGKPGDWVALPTQIKDAALSIDLVQRAFATKLTMFNENASANLFAKGSVDANGHFLWELPGSNMSVRGVLAGQNGNQAGYIFNTQLAPTIWATGVTAWKRP
jgi:hypothetical protein